MAKKQEIVTDDPGGLPSELQVGSTDNVAPPDIQPVLPEELDSDEPIAGEEAPEFVVVKGHTVRHNGADYPENTVISVLGVDAERLIALGVIVRLDDLRAQLLSGNQ
ncbi:hypothetical protein PSI23_20580 [Xenorhabdus sp. XENO-10]|uniref:Uncharacterized protein n=1 Tax=Xenorhabdus yunnanensis TaxID=3025878 RepID=A0ABT5LKH5_9GAMM|nr:hypothetical protein [Xenorhabdus yunnanensis]MDC9591610.1 hypothetical protein [Xenorhabdus yunnanensis]